MHGEKFNKHIKHYKTKQHASWLSIQYHFKSPKLEQLSNHSPSCLSSIEGAKWAYWCMAARPRASSIKLSMGKGCDFSVGSCIPSDFESSVSLWLPATKTPNGSCLRMSMAANLLSYKGSKSKWEVCAIPASTHLTTAYKLPDYLQLWWGGGHSVISRNIPIPSPWV